MSVATNAVIGAIARTARSVVEVMLVPTLEPGTDRTVFRDLDHPVE